MHLKDDEEFDWEKADNYMEIPERVLRNMMWKNGIAAFLAGVVVTTIGLGILGFIFNY